MALLWFDGFEGYNDVNDVPLVDRLNATGSFISFNPDYGRRGSYGMSLSQANTYYQIDISDTNPATVIFGIAFYPTASYSYNVGFPMLGFYDGYPIGSSNLHLKFYITDLGYITVLDSASSTIATGTIQLSTLQWYYLEFKVTISDTVGQITTKVNGITDINTSADKDTCNGSNVYVGGINLSCNYAPPAYYDDLYVCDISGDAPCNDFLGDIRIDPLRVTGAGSHAEFTPSAGSNYENVDESPGPDDDSTYNDGDTTNNEDSYALGDLPSPSGTTIYGVKSQITVRKTDAGTRKCKVLTRSGGSDYYGSEETLSDTFLTFTQIHEDNPDDSNPWEDADVNGMEVGILVTA